MKQRNGVLLPGVAQQPDGSSGFWVSVSNLLEATSGNSPPIQVVGNTEGCRAKRRQKPRWLLLFTGTWASHQEGLWNKVCTGPGLPVRLVPTSRRGTPRSSQASGCVAGLEGEDPHIWPVEASPTLHTNWNPGCNTRFPSASSMSSVVWPLAAVGSCTADALWDRLAVHCGGRPPGTASCRRLGTLPQQLLFGSSDLGEGRRGETPSGRGARLSGPLGPGRSALLEPSALRPAAFAAFLAI